MPTRRVISKLALVVAIAADPTLAGCGTGGPNGAGGTGGTGATGAGGTSATGGAGGASATGGAAGRSATGGTVGSGGTAGAGDTGGAGGASSGYSCAYTVSGEDLIPTGCNIYAQVTTGGTVEVNVSNGGAFGFNAVFATLTTLMAGTYTQADASSYSGDYPVQVSDFYVCSANCQDATGKPSSPQGTFVLTITDPGPATVAFGPTMWSPHGTLVVVMPARPNGAQSGSVTANVTF